jgi:hypothetical protein
LPLAVCFLPLASCASCASLASCFFLSFLYNLPTNDP